MSGGVRTGARRRWCRKWEVAAVMAAIPTAGSSFVSKPSCGQRTAAAFKFFAATRSNVERTATRGAQAASVFSIPQFQG